MGIKVELQGFEKLDHTLLELAGATGERIIRKAMRAGGEVVQAAITERAPVRPDLRGLNPKNPAWSLPTGALKSDIELHVTKDKETGGIAAYIEPGKYSKFVATLLEYGHEMHHGRKYRGGKYLGTVRAHPFVRPGLDESEAAAIATIEETIAAEIQKEISKLGGS